MNKKPLDPIDMTLVPLSIREGFPIIRYFEFLQKEVQVIQLSEPQLLVKKWSKPDDIEWYTSIRGETREITEAEFEEVRTQLEQLKKDFELRAEAYEESEDLAEKGIILRLFAIWLDDYLNDKIHKDPRDCIRCVNDTLILYQWGMIPSHMKMEDILERLKLSKLNQPVPDELELLPSDADIQERTSFKSKGWTSKLYDPEELPVSKRSKDNLSKNLINAGNNKGEKRSDQDTETKQSPQTNLNSEKERNATRSAKSEELALTGRKSSEELSIEERESNKGLNLEGKTTTDKIVIDGKKTSEAAELEVKKSNEGGILEGGKSSEKAPFIGAHSSSLHPDSTEHTQASKGIFSKRDQSTDVPTDSILSESKSQNVSSVSETINTPPGIWTHITAPTRLPWYLALTLTITITIVLRLTFNSTTTPPPNFSPSSTETPQTTISTDINEYGPAIIPQNRTPSFPGRLPEQTFDLDRYGTPPQNSPTGIVAIGIAYESRDENGRILRWVQLTNGQRLIISNE